MKIKKYLKDHSYIIIIALALNAFQVMILSLVRIETSILIMFEILFWLMIIAFLVIDYLRKQNFYTSIEEIVDKLDQKYLSHELLERPSFLEGQMIYDLLETIDYAYLEDIQTYKNKESDYQEYIELWVHEVKTPLAASKLLVENEQSNFSKKIDEELEKISSYVDQTLYYSRSAYAQQDYLIKELNIKDVIYQSIRSHQRSFLEKNISLVINVEDYYIYSDEKWLIFIFQQLLDNALKYSDNNKQLYITLNTKKDSVEVIIEDEGIGIKDNEKKRVFQKFFTGTNGRRFSKSTGIGLYLCQRLCEKLYIGLTLESSEGKGTTVCLTFPDSSMFHLR